MAQLKNLMKEYPFATLVTYSEAGIEATHLPVIYRCVNGNELIQGHIAKVNKLWESVKNGSDVLLIFNGPNGYISPNYYPSKRENGRAVPTWNYIAVHAKGNIQCFHVNDRKLEVVSHLTNLHEVDQPQPWSVSDAPNVYIEKMLSAIVGLEIEVTSLIGKWKVSQNQSGDNQQGVITGLLSEVENNSHKMAEIIKTNIT